MEGSDEGDIVGSVGVDVGSVVGVVDGIEAFAVDDTKKR